MLRIYVTKQSRVKKKMKVDKWWSILTWPFVHNQDVYSETVRDHKKEYSIMALRFLLFIFSVSNLQSYICHCPMSYNEMWIMIFLISKLIVFGCNLMTSRTCLLNMSGRSVSVLNELTMYGLNLLLPGCMGRLC